MAQAVNFNGANTALTAPPGREGDVQTLYCFRNGAVIVSCWQFTREELEAIIANDGKCFLSVFGGITQVPVFVGDEEAVRQVVADYGPVWERG